MQINLSSRRSTNWTRRRLMNVLGVALLALCFSQVPAQAQEPEQKRQVTIIQDLVAVGLVPGQTLSITLSNPEGSGVSFRGHVKILDGNRGLVFETPEAEIAPGEFHSFEINRSDISSPGDPRTGRFQAAGRILGVKRATVERAQARIDKLPLSIEIVDNDSGKTVAISTTKISLVPIGGVPVPID